MLLLRVFLCERKTLDILTEYVISFQSEVYLHLQGEHTLFVE